jgi:hypothetical protein
MTEDVSIQRHGFFTDLAFALFCILFFWMVISTALCILYILFGLLVCSLNSDAAICGDTIAGSIQFFYWNMWLKLLNPWTWLGVMYGVTP